MADLSTDEIYKRLAEKGVSPEDAAAGVAAARNAKPSRTRQKIMNVIDDLAGRLLYYGRKEDDDLPVFALEDAIIAGVVTVDELVTKMREAIDRSVENRRKNPNEKR